MGNLKLYKESNLIKRAAVAPKHFENMEKNKVEIRQRYILRPVSG